MSNLGARGRLSSSQSWPSLVAICLLLGSACGGAATLAPGAPEILPSSRTVLMVDGAELTAWHRIDLWLPLGDAGLGLPMSIELIADSGEGEWRCQVSAPWLEAPVEVRLPMGDASTSGRSQEAER